jgi:tetratricopeptide (TPR) repeat protein
MSHILIRYPLTLWLLSVAYASCGQSLRAFEKAGDQSAEAKDYYAAMHHYTRGLAIRPDDVNLCFKYATMAQRFHAYETAEKWYLKVTDHAQASRYPTALFQLGMVAKSLGNYAKAHQYFANFLEKYGAADEPNAKKAAAQIEDLKWAIQTAAAPEMLEIVRLGKQVNSPYSEFGPFAIGDTLYFSALRFENKSDKHNPKRMISKILYSVGGSTAKPARDGINTEDGHSAHVAISPLSRRIYFTRCAYINASEIRCALFYREPDKRGRWKGNEVKLPAPVNLPGYTATHPSIGYDSIAHTEVLFFASDRPGGAGGLDLWKAPIKEKGILGTPEPLKALNTPDDDITPFFHTPTQTLWFSSNGRTSLGGFDIYSSKKNDDWTAPANAGSPLNSSYNDLYPTISEDGLSGFFASNRPGSQFLDENNKACCNDLYRFRYVLPIPEDSADSFDADVRSAGQPPISDSGTKEIASNIPTTLEEFLPLALYFDNDEPDKRTRKITTNQSYLETFERYYLRKSDYLENCGLRLKDDAKSDAEDRMEGFFENEIARGSDFLVRFSQILLQRLQAGDQVEIFIKGFTSPRAQSDYNLALGGRRISSLRNHFSTWENGTLKPFLISGQLKVSERSFGETTAAKNISDALDDLAGSVYSIGAMRERRVEIVEIKSSDKR